MKCLFNIQQNHLRTGVAACFLAGSLALAVPHAAFGGEPAGQTPSRRTAAFLDVDGAPLGALVEQRLLADARAAWLERTEIGRVLAEQEIGKMFGAGAGPERVALGRLLKADLLVVLRDGEYRGQPFAELVVAETGGGLRLLARKVPLAGRIEADADTLVRLVDQALAKHNAEINEVYAVPPFYSRDLTFEYESLKKTYAALVEQRLLAEPGVVVVELAEAEAIAREYALASPDDGPTRRLPLYLLGEYRNEDVGDQRRIAITMRLKRGDKILRTIEKEVAPNAAADYLLQAVGELAGWTEDREIGASSRIEARQLAERGTEFLKLGNWEEALALLQASLLLRPNQPDVHAQVNRAAATLADKSSVPKDVETLKRNIAYRRLALRHLDPVARSTSNLYSLYHSVWQTLRTHRGINSLWDAADLPDEITESLALLDKEERRFLVPLAHRYARAKSWDLSGRILSLATEHMAPMDRYAQSLLFILEYQDQAPPATLIEDYGHAGYSGFPNSFEARQFLERVASLEQANPGLREAARASLKHLNQERESRWQAAAEGAPVHPRREASSPPPGFRLRPLQVTWRHPDGRKGTLNRIQGCLPIAGGADVLWHRDVYLMKKTGEATLVWPDKPMQNYWLRSVVYDGQYVWFTARIHHQVPQVWVFDPVSGRRWQLTAEHGLPLFLPSKANALITHDVLAATVAPGKAILAGSFGRAWLARVEFDPDGDHRVKVFHEARNVEDRHNMAWRKDPQAAFMTSYLVSLSGSDPDPRQLHQRVIVGRGVSVLSGYPLIVDPHTLSVRVSEEYWHKDADADLWRGALYYTGGIPPRYKELAFMRFAAPDLTPEPLMRGVKEGIVVMQDDAVNVVGKRWWRGSLADGKLECLGPVPWRFDPRKSASHPPVPTPLKPEDLRLAALVRSNHYGLLASYYASDPKIGSTLAQVSFDVSDGERPPAAKGVAQGDDLPEPTGSLPVVDNVWQCLARASLAAVSRDRKYFATADGGRILIWSAAELRPMRELPRQADRLLDLDFSPDGQLLASVGRDRTVRIWNVREGREARKVAFPNHVVTRALFAPQGRQFVTDSGYVTWWDMDTGLPTKIASMRDIAGFLPDGTLLGTSQSTPQRLIAWNPVDQSYRQVWGRFVGGPMWLSANGKRLCTRNRVRLADGRFGETPLNRIWDLDSGQEIEHADASRPLTLDRTNLGDKLTVTSFIATGQSWRFEPVTPPK